MIEGLREIAGRHVGDMTVPGLVALVARGGQVHVTTAGHLAAGDPAPIGRDAIFRIASLTKPVIGAAAMLLVQDGDMTLDDEVDHWLPELSERRVLRSYDAELSRCRRRGRSRWRTCCPSGSGSAASSRRSPCL